MTRSGILAAQALISRFGASLTWVITRQALGCCAVSIEAVLAGINTSVAVEIGILQAIAVT